MNIFLVLGMIPYSLIIQLIYSNPRYLAGKDLSLGVILQKIGLSFQIVMGIIGITINIINL